MARYVPIFLLMMSTLTVFAQKSSYKLTTLPLNDVQAFTNKAANWKTVAAITGSFDQKVPDTKPGTGVIYNNFNEKVRFTEDANIFTKMEHGDIFIALDFVMPKGSNAGIYLQGRYEIQMFDSWGVKNPKPSDCGGIYERWDEKRPEGQKGYEGHSPNVNAALAPNLWQHLEIEFNAPRFDSNGRKIQPARFVKVTLNGIVIHENVVVYGPTRASAFEDEKPSGPIMIQGDHGPVAVRNIQYALLNDFSIPVSDLQYSYYEGKFNNEFAKVTNESLVRTGKTDAIDIKLADNPNDMCIVFDGKLNISETDEYNFTLLKRGAAKLAVDGVEVIKDGDWFADQSATMRLEKGLHTFRVSYVKNFSWARAGLGLIVGKQNTRPVALHTDASMPKDTPPPLIAVKPLKEPEVIRSYLVHNNKKKTHVISYGDPFGINFSYDLNQAGLLQCWRGDFLNVTEMWHERGEPQTAAPMGAVVILAGRAPVAPDKDPLPDTLDDRKELIYKGYTFNDRRIPEFQYSLNGVGFYDLIEPDGTRGLKRTIRMAPNPANGNTLLRLAEGTTIVKVAENVYSVNNQQYYLQVSPPGKMKPEIRTNGARTELVLRLAPGTSSVQYNLVW